MNVKENDFSLINRKPKPKPMLDNRVSACSHTAVHPVKTIYTEAVIFPLNQPSLYEYIDELYHLHACALLSGMLLHLACSLFSDSSRGALTL